MRFFHISLDKERHSLLDLCARDDIRDVHVNKLLEQSDIITICVINVITNRTRERLLVKVHQ